MVDDKEKLLYKPKLEPTRRYDSNAAFTKDDYPRQDPPAVPDKAKEIIDDFEELKNIISIAPKDVHSVTQLINKLIQRAKVAFPNGYRDTDQKEREIIHSEKNPHLSPINNDIQERKFNFAGLPNLFPSPTNIAIDIIKPRSIVDIAIDKYRKDTIDLQKYYLTRLQSALQTYFHQILMVMAESNVPDVDSLSMKFDGKAVKIPPGQNLEHLRDHIMRSQIIREQKSRLFKKTHNVDQTIMHMRTWHAAEKERERYYTEKYGNSSTYLENESNSILQESRSAYDSRYSQSLYDMYKYLNSSVIVVSDILDMSLKEAKAKGALLQAGVDIFAVTEHVSHVNDAVASAVGDGKLDEPASKQSEDSKSKNTDSTSSGTKDKLSNLFEKFTGETPKSFIEQTKHNIKGDQLTDVEKKEKEDAKKTKEQKKADEKAAAKKKKDDEKAFQKEVDEAIQRPEQQEVFRQERVRKVRDIQEKDRKKALKEFKKKFKRDPDMNNAQDAHMMLKYGYQGDASYDSWAADQ